MKRKSSLLKKAKLPDNPGVYFFKDKQGNILYIGRATSLKDRVKSYFAIDLIHTRGPLLVDMITKTERIEHTETDSVLEAIILENNLIKEYQPYYNTKDKDNKSYNYVVITDEDFPRVILVRGRTFDIVNQELLKFKIKYQFGPYPQASLLKEALRIIRKIFPFRDIRSSIPHQESFYRSIGLSPDMTSSDARKDYQRTIRNLTLFFQGKKSDLVKTLEREMKEYAENREFEKAGEIKKTLYALTHIQDVALIKSDSMNTMQTGFRIEAYDIAHLSGKNTVGVMVVSYDGELDTGSYRKFKISKDRNDDTAGLREILIRRFTHTEWQLPNLIVIDGGIGQKRVAEEIIKGLNIDIVIVSVAKNDSHKVDHILGDTSIIHVYKDMIIKVNAEAHRFAISYHRSLRKRNFLKS